MPSLHGYVSSPETAAGNVVIFFLSSKGKKIENIYYRSNKSDVTIADAKVWLKCILIKIKGTSTAWRLPSHTAEQCSYVGWHVVLVLVWTWHVSSHDMHLPTTHSPALALPRSSIPKSTKCCSWEPSGIKM